MRISPSDHALWIFRAIFKKTYREHGHYERSVILIPRILKWNIWNVSKRWIGWFFKLKLNWKLLRQNKFNKSLWLNFKKFWKCSDSVESSKSDFIRIFKSVELVEEVLEQNVNTKKDNEKLKAQLLAKYFLLTVDWQT